jgi:hypothetical protein
MRPLVIAIAALAACTAPVARAADKIVTPSYVEETATAGINSVYAGDWQYMVGGGAAAFDCNDDGFEDLWLAGGEGKSKLFVNRSHKGGALSFAETKSGAEFAATTGAYPIDIDGDGIKDLIVLRVGETIALKGLGGCRFERANETWGFTGGDAWWTSFSAMWEHGAAWPTLALGAYVDRKEDTYPWGTCTDNWLIRPETSGDRRHFAGPLPLKPSFCPLSILFTDWNRSGTPSLRVSNDREYYKGGQEQMWKIPAGGKPELYKPEEGWKYLRIWGMGIASYDVNSDGYPDYFLTSMADSKLQSLANIPKDGLPKPGYADIAFAKGVTAHRPYTGGEWKPSTGWHTDFQDVNNDGYVDLFIAKGNVSTMPDFAIKDPNNLLVQQPDGKFVEMGDKAGVASMKTSRGAALADFNLDGLVDLVVVNRWENAQIWRNTTKGAGHFLELKLQDDAGNRDGIGSWLEVKLGDRTIRREITIGGGHAGGSLGWIHVGTGDFATVPMRVIWPDGKADAWQDVATDGFYRLERGKKAEPVQVK